MSIHQVMNDFRGGASILETRQELMDLGWSAKKANGWLLKAMRSKGDAVQARSGDSEINVMQAVLPDGVSQEIRAQGPGYANAVFTPIHEPRDGGHDLRGDRAGAGMLQSGSADGLQQRDSQDEAKASVASHS